MFFDGFEKSLGGDFANLEVVDHPTLKIEEIRKYFVGISKLPFSTEPGELFCDLKMIERKDDVSQVVKDDFNGRLSHLFSLTPVFSLSRLCRIRDGRKIWAGQTVGFLTLRVRSFKVMDN